MITSKISVDKLLACRKLVTHANCSDGLASAMILKDVLPNLEVVFVTHNSPEHENLEPEEGMIFCDFAPVLRTAQRFSEAGALILDHHKGSKDIVALFGDNGVFASEKEDPGISGAVLAYEFVWKPLKDSISGRVTNPYKMGDFARLVGIRDTWVKSSGEWDKARALNEVLFFYGPEYWLKNITNIEGDVLCLQSLTLGAQLLANQERNVQKTIGEVLRFNVQGKIVQVHQNLRVTSDLAEASEPGTDLVVGFKYLNEKTPEGVDNPCLIFSCRSRNGFDVGTFAKAHGGGGHSAAGGFKVQVNLGDPNPYQYIRDLVQDYLKPSLFSRIKKWLRSVFTIQEWKDGALIPIKPKLTLSAFKGE